MSAASANAARSPQNTLAGSGSYFRFTLKHNLVRYLVWVAVVVGMLAYVAMYYKSLFTSQEEIDKFLALAAAPGMSALTGMAGSATLGGAVWTKIWMTLAMTLAIGMVFQVTHGARADESNGRTELFRSRPFGIHSTLTAVVGGALSLTLVIGVLSIFTAHALGLDPEGTGMSGSIAFGLSLIACGWVGVGVGALTNQLSVSSSLANSTGSIIIVGFYVLRMIGDMGNNAAIWLSPIGWAEKMAPWKDDKLWLVIPAIVLTAILIANAFMIEARRDYGSGVLQEKKGRAAAKPLMRRSWGLILHLYKGSIIGWAIGMALAGLMFGSVANSMLDLLAGMELGMLKGTGMDALLGLLLCFIALVAMVLPIQIMTGLRSDEARGLTESQLAGGMSRVRLVMEYLIVSTCALVMLLLLGSASMGASYGAMVGDNAMAVKMAANALVYLPGILAIMGIVVLLFGFAPRATIPVTWFLYGAMYFDVLIGDALKLPAWVVRCMPFTGTPRVPFEALNASVVWFALAAVALIVLGIAGFCKRDVPR